MVPHLTTADLRPDRFDQLGSGVINVHRYLPLYANGATPIFQESEQGFLTTLPLADNPADDQETEQVTEQVAGQVETAVKTTPTASGKRRERFWLPV